MLVLSVRALLSRMASSADTIWPSSRMKRTSRSLSDGRASALMQQSAP